MIRNRGNGGHRSECATGNEIVIETGNKTGNETVAANKTGSETVAANKTESETVNLKKTGSETVNIKKTGSETVSLRKTGGEIGNVNKIGTRNKVGNVNKTRNGSKHVDKNCNIKTALTPLVCRCMTAIFKAEMVNAQTQTEVIIQKTTGVQCQRILEPSRRLATKRATTAKDMKSVTNAVEDKSERQKVKDGADKGSDTLSFPLCEDDVIIT